MVGCTSKDTEKKEKDAISKDEIMEYLDDLTDPYVELAEIMQANTNNKTKKVNDKHQELEDTSLKILNELEEDYEPDINEIENLIDLADTLHEMTDKKKNDYDMSHIVDYSETIGRKVGNISRNYMNDELPSKMDQMVSEVEKEQEEPEKTEEQKDFFLDSSNDELYQKSIKKGEYKKLYKEVKAYIDDENAEEDDSSYEIIKAIKPILELIKQVEINYDEFDERSTIYYKDLEDISSENFIVPFLENVPNVEKNGDDMFILAGFEKEGWMFIDSIRMKVGDEKQILATSGDNVKSDTLGGSLIREEYTDKWSERHEEFIEEIIDSDNKDVTMRFEGEKGEMDYTLTDNDIKAIEILSKFKEANKNLADIYSSAKEELDI